VARQEGKYGVDEWHELPEPLPMFLEGSPLSPLGPRVSVDWREGVQRLHILPRRKWKVVGVGLGLLLLGVLKEFRVIDDFLTKGNWWDDLLMALIVVGFLFWPIAFVGEFFGSEIVSVERGELVVSRGIGRLRRVFRYAVGSMSELTSCEPSAEGDGKKHLHNIFIRAKTGAVKFFDGDKTVYFAESLTEIEGETVVGWLERKLPRTAFQYNLEGGMFRA
jgi:hypothetical protein